MTTADWKTAARDFFGARSRGIAGNRSLQALCFVSGRDSRIWSDRDTYDEMISSIVTDAAAGDHAHLLEVGCAAGFVAWGLAPRVAAYTGVDLSRDAVRHARSLAIGNAEFEVADGSALPFDDDRFDCAISCDVFTNFPTFDGVRPIIVEMLRVVRPGGRVLAGSIPDAAHEQDTYATVAEVGQRLAEDGREPWRPDRQARGWRRLLPGATRGVHEDQGGIVCYFFQRADFEQLAAELGVELAFTPVHSRNPYAEYRFNAVFKKPQR